jgi:hypothetical protein
MVAITQNQKKCFPAITADAKAIVSNCKATANILCHVTIVFFGHVDFQNTCVMNQIELTQHNSGALLTSWQGLSHPTNKMSNIRQVA